MIELEAHHDAVLSNANKEVRVDLHDLLKAGAHIVRDVPHHGADFWPLHHLKDFHRNDATQLGTTACRNVAKTIFLEPATTALADQYAGDRINPTADPFPGHHDVRLNAVLGATPDFAAPHQTSLNLVRYIERVVALTQLLYSGKIAFLRHGEAISGRDSFHDNGSHITTPQCVFHCV